MFQPFMLSSNPDLSKILFYVFLGLAAILLIITLIILGKRIRNRSKKRKIPYEAILAAFGGIDNIVEATSQNSRLQVSLKEYQLFQPEVIKSLGGEGILKTSKKITIIYGEDSKEIAHYIVHLKK